MPNNTRVVVAALLSPAILPLLYFAGTVWFSGYLDTGPSRLHKLLLETSLGILPVSYLVSLGLGLPVFLVLRGLDKLSMWSVLIASCLSGIVAGIVFALSVENPDGSSGMLQAEAACVALAGGFAATLVAFLFCLISGTRRKHQCPRVVQ